MSLDPKSSTTPASKPPLPRGNKGIRIFTYPKVIFIFPTLIVSLLCAIGMALNGDKTEDPAKKRADVAVAKPAAKTATPDTAAPAAAKPSSFETVPNLLGVLFLAVFAFNLMVMALDFPRFTIVAGLLLGLFLISFVLWIGSYFEFDLLDRVRSMMTSIYVTANTQFYVMIVLILTVLFAMIYVSRYLDYWEILPNEILHHHGPLSDLERYPTLNLKFDKEIPDVIEHLFLGAGKLVLHVSDERKSIVLENVLFINRVENALKGLMSRMEVRLTSDQEVANL
jgi:hypothetical protein